MTEGLDITQYDSTNTAALAAWTNYKRDFLANASRPLQMDIAAALIRDLWHNWGGVVSQKDEGNNDKRYFLIFKDDNHATMFMLRWR